MAEQQRVLMASVTGTMCFSLEVAKVLSIKYKVTDWENKQFVVFVISLDEINTTDKAIFGVSIQNVEKHKGSDADSGFQSNYEIVPKSFII